MTASVRSAGTVFQTNGVATASFVIQAPSNIEAGDLMFAIIVVDDTGGALALNVQPPPTGWVVLANVTDDGPIDNDLILAGSNHGMQIWTKFYTATDGTSFTFTDADNSHHCAAAIIAIQDPGAIDIFGFIEAAGASTTPTCPDVTTGEASLLLRIYGGAKASNNATPSDVPAGTTEIFHTTSGGGVGADDVLIGAAHESQSVAGATGTAAFSISGNESVHSTTIAIDLTTLYPRPAATTPDTRSAISYPFVRRKAKLGSV